MEPSLIHIHYYTFIISYFSPLTRFVAWLMLKAFASAFDNIQVDPNHLTPVQRASQEVQVSVNILIHISTESFLYVPLNVLFTVTADYVTSQFPMSIKNVTWVQQQL